MATAWKLQFLSIFFWLATLTYSKPTPIDPSQQQDGKGDIVQLWSLIDTADEANVMRNALKPNSPSRWTTKKDSAKGYFIIPFIVGGKFTKKEKKTIGRAMNAIAQNSCVKFQRRTRERDFVEITNRRGEGCYTMVGRTRGKNVVNLETNERATCLLYPTVIHELLHIVGLWHEQMRYDRDKYIKVHYENVAPSLRPQFEKISSGMSTTYGVKYDYRSVMHYRRDAFTRNGRPTMQTKVSKFQNIIGNAKDASAGDWRKVCAIYRCKKCMKKAMAPRKDNAEAHHEGSELESSDHMNDPIMLREANPDVAVPVLQSGELSSVEQRLWNDEDRIDEDGGVSADGIDHNTTDDYAIDNDADSLLDGASLMEDEPSSGPRDSQGDTLNNEIHDGEPLQTIELWDKDETEYFHCVVTVENRLKTVRSENPIVNPCIDDWALLTRISRNSPTRMTPLAIDSGDSPGGRS